MRVFRVPAFLFTMLLLLISGCEGRDSQSIRVKLQLVATGFSSPVALLRTDDGSQRPMTGATVPLVTPRVIVTMISAILLLEGVRMSWKRRDVSHQTMYATQNCMTKSP